MKAFLPTIKAGVLAATLSLACLGVAAPVAAQEMVKGNGGKIRMLYVESGTTSYLIHAFKKFALDKKYNIEIVPTPNPTTTTAVVAMQGGSAELANFGWNDLSRYQQGGYSVVGVTPWLRWGADFYLVAADSPIKAVSDLKGKKIGTSSKVTLNYVLLKAVAKDNFNLDLDKDAQVYEGAQPLLRGLAEQGQIDVAGMFNSVSPAMIATGKFRSFMKVSELVSMYGLPDTPYLFWSFDGKYAKANPENVKAYVRMYQDAIQILKTNDEVWLERGRELQQTDDVTRLFMDAARTDLILKFDENTEKNIQIIFDKFLPIAGKEAFGIDKLTPGYITSEYQ